jgi:hypothetical protein
MPPWPEWQFEYMGSRFLGRLLGFWSSLWVFLVRKLFRLLTKTARNRRNSSSCSSKGYNFLDDPRPSGTEFSFARKLSRIAFSTLLTLVVWRIVTLKAVWVAAGESGDRFLTAILLFVSASWVISLVWICFSKSRQTETPAVTTTRLQRKPRYTRSTRARAS